VAQRVFRRRHSRSGRRVTLDESINMAFLVVLELMTPAERVAFILHDVFRYPFTEVAEIVGRTPAASWPPPPAAVFTPRRFP
jgi:DNA-directed RNA polymerase specialized sigma24 family protein